MIRKIFCAIGLSFAFLTGSYAAFISFGVSSGSSVGGDLPFALPTGHNLFFMAPTGNDACNGLSPTIASSGTCAWATPNHAVSCGDVILAAPGTYNNQQFFGFGTVSNCPSSSGGIDGLGQIYFAIVLCAGTDLAACVISTSGNGNPLGLVTWGDGPAGGTNWAMEGFNVPSGSGTGTFGCATNGCRSFTILTQQGCSVGVKSHHIAVINSITSNSMQGFGFNDCGILGNTANAFADYVAAVGMIVQDSNHNGDFQGGICVGAIDFVGLGNWDTVSGTHAYMYNNYAMNNQSPACVSQYDGEAFYIDSPDAHIFTQQAVMANNIGYSSGRGCVVVTYHGWNTTAGMLAKMVNNTCYNNDLGQGAGEQDASQIAFNSGCNTPSPIAISATNNISYQDHARGSVGFPAWLYTLGDCGAPTGARTVGGTGSENVLKSTVGGTTPCPNGGGSAGGNGSNSTCDVMFNNTPFPTLTNNFFVNPTFTNTTDLLANRMGTPNCAGFENTTQCMGWDARTGTLTTPSVISDLTATCAQCTGKGFQRPSTTCNTNTDYPTWLKGIVYLHANGGFTAGATITRKMGLATIPCGL